MPATWAFIGTPASINARQPPHTEAIDEEPFDSVISDTTRSEYPKSAAEGIKGLIPRLARRPWPISRRLGLPTRPVSPVANGGKLYWNIKRSLYSPAMASITCSSRAVPSVAVTKAWVSPRVKRADPWTLGRTPVRIEIGRTVRVSRPSIRGCPSRIC